MNDDQKIFQNIPQISRKHALLLTTNLYNKMLGENLKHDSYFNTKGFIKCGPEFDKDYLTLEMITKKEPKTTVTQLPYPIVVSKSNIIDFCKEEMTKKLKYIKEYNHYVRLHRGRHQTYINEHMDLPRYIVNLLEDKVKDPDCYLKTNYNYYYTGGNLDMLTVNNYNYFTHVIEGKSLGFVSADSLENIFLYDLNDVIYGIKTYENENNAFTLIRHKQKLSLYKTDVDMTVNIFELWTDTSDTAPFIDCKFNQYDMNVAVTLKANSNFCIHDTNSRKKVNLKLDKDYFQFDFMNKRLIFAISPKRMLLYDTRSYIDRLDKDFQTEHLKCDYLSTFAFTNDENYVYTLSTHNIKKLDLRMLMPVTSCPHLLSQTPSMCKFFNLNGQDAIFASGTNYNERFLYVENYVPQKMPNLLETYHESCLSNGPILKKGLEEHLKLSTTGLSVLPKDEGFDLYTSNYNGEIFCNEIANKKLDNEKSCNIFWQWANNVEHIEEPLKITDMRPMYKVKNMLTWSMDDDRLERYIHENLRLKEFHKLEVVDNNMNLKDIWEDDDEGSDDDEQISPNDKVQNWLHETFKTED